MLEVSIDRMKTWHGQKLLLLGDAAHTLQMRAYRMVGKPLFVQHLMFTMLGLVMRFKKFAPPALPRVEPAQN